MTNIVWFRQDLRTADNPALAHAAANGPVVGLYILDETATPSSRPPGGASKWWLHHSLRDLEKSLGGLVCLRGDPRHLVPDLARRIGASGVFWNRRYEQEGIECDTALKSSLKSEGYEVESFNASLLFEPWEIRTQSGGPFKVFSPFWRACLRQTITRPEPAPRIEAQLPQDVSENLDDWQLLPTHPDWAAGLRDAWEPGEGGARRRLDGFLNDGLAGYRQLRDRPDLENVSRLSPHLHFGEISPRQLWAAAMMRAEEDPKLQKDVDKFLAEIGWREFSYHLLYHFPTLTTQNLNTAFDAYPWIDSTEQLRAWQKGMTGYPLVDAGMRELWATGYMHNRVRMITASFLTKHLRIDWRDGENWFWDTLVDADLANNSASWQWVAGSGADAAPYFRIFNPIIQGRKFDPQGAYVSRWCPELGGLPVKFMHAPWEAPAGVLADAGIVLGETYPHPVVDHAAARAAALNGYDTVKQAASG